MMEQEIQKCLGVLRAGGIILYPTDTIWGIGCDATNENAVEKVLRIKKREGAAPTLKGEMQAPFRAGVNGGGKSFIVLVSDDAMLNRFVKEVPALAWDLMEANDPEENQEARPLTIIYDAARGLAKNVLAADGSIGVRMIRRQANEFCHKLIHKFGKPVVSTSANISGMPAQQNFSDISEEIINAVDYVVKWRQDEHFNAAPSSIIRLKENGEFKIIRE